MKRNLLNLLFILLFIGVPIILHGQNPIARKVLVMLVNFTDRQTQPFTIEQAQATNTSVNAFYIEQSYNKVGFSFDVMPWTTLPMNFVCDENQIASLSQTTAINAGFVPSNYQHLIYAFPGNGCGWTGSAEYAGRQVWINTYYDLPSVAHELGHNLGLYHSEMHYPDGTTTLDRFDVMGSSQSAHFNLYQKEKLGWAFVPEEPTGVYIIDPIETRSVSGIKIRSALGEYYIERRTAYGFDSIFDNPNFYPNIFNGFLIHFKDSYRSPLLLDMTPETPSIYDPALTPGRTFTDGSISITAISTDQVSVTAPVFTPTPTPTPIPTPTPKQPVCVKSNPSGKCLKWK